MLKSGWKAKKVSNLEETPQYYKCLQEDEISNVAEVQPQGILSLKKPVGTRKTSGTEKAEKLELIQVRPSRRKQSEEQVYTYENIDAYYKGSLVFLSEYAPEVFSHLMKIESQTPIQPWPLDSLVTSNMRCKVIDWIASIVDFHRLLQETFHMAVSLFDRYLQANRETEKANLQLVAVCCLSLAVKYEELQDVSVRDLLELTRNAYTRKQFVNMEISILKTVGFALGRPLPITFLRRFNMAAKADRFQHAYGKFLLDLCMLEAKLCHVPPSLLASASTFIALCIIKKEVSPEFWTPTFVHYTTYKFERLKPLVFTMATVLSKRGGEFKAVCKKYAKSEQFGVSETIDGHERTLSKMRNLK